MTGKIERAIHLWVNIMNSLFVQIVFFAISLNWLSGFEWLKKISKKSLVKKGLVRIFNVSILCFRKGWFQKVWQSQRNQNCILYLVYLFPNAHMQTIYLHHFFQAVRPPFVIRQRLAKPTYLKKKLWKKNEKKNKLSRIMDRREVLHVHLYQCLK